MLELWKRPALEIAALIRSRELSCVDVVEAALERVDSINPRVNAVVERLDAPALSQARAIDASLAMGESLTGSLVGVPFTAKLNSDYVGSATTNGVRAFADRIADRDNPCIANLKRAGAICIGRTNVPAFSARYFTDNDLHGRTLNPWNSGITPGGSSGGAAVSVATGMVPLAQGNDRAGSIRYPAHITGLYGMRATVGRVPTHDGTLGFEPTLGSQLTNVQGCFARSIDDLRAAFDVMAAADLTDPFWIPAISAPPGRPQIGIVTRWPDTVIAPGSLDALRSVADLLVGEGYDVAEVDLPDLDEAGRLFWSLTCSEDSGQLQALVERFGDRAIIAARRSTLSYAPRAASIAEYVALMQRRSALARAFAAYARRRPVTILPVTLDAPLAIGTDQRGDDAVHGMLRGFGPLTAISFLGLPSIAVPTGIYEGLPQGVQVVGGRFMEEACFTVSAVIAQHRPFVWPPGRQADGAETAERTA